MARDIEAEVKVKDSSAAGLTSVERNFKRTQDKLKREQEQSAKDFSKTAATIAGSGSKLGALFGENVASGLTKAAPALIPVLAGAAAAAAPVIGGTIAASVIGGAAGLGIIGGVVLAARNPMVKTAGAELGKNLLQDLEGRSRVFVAPLLQGMDLIDRRFDQSADTIGKIFQDASRYVLPLIDAGTRAVQRIIEGVAAATANAGPVIDELGQGIQLVADEVARMFESLADDGVSAAVALRQTFQLVASAVRIAATAVNILVESYGFLAKVGAFGKDAQLQYITLEANAKIAAEANTELARTTVEVGDAGRRSQGGTFGYAKSVAQAGVDAETTAAATKLYEQALKDNAKAAEEAAGAQRSLFSDTTRVGEAFDRAKEAADKNGKTLSANTEKGRANRDALANLATSLNTYRDNQAKAGASTSTMTATLRSQRQRFYEVALQMTGNKKKANELTNSLLGIPTKRTTNTTVNKAAAAKAARDLRADINSIPRNVTTTVTVNVNASRLASVEKRLARIDNYGMAAMDSFGITAPGQGNNRTGGPIELTSNLSISLDGQPMRRATVRAIEENDRRNAFRTKVGRRVA